jgi:hypothetical protein
LHGPVLVLTEAVRLELRLPAPSARGEQEHGENASR